MDLRKLNQLVVPTANHAKALMKTNVHSQTYGLVLSEADAVRIVAFTDETLRNLGRIELSSELIPRIIRSFSSSPYIMQYDYADTVCQLLECFYYLRHEGFDQLSDDDLIEVMRSTFDYQCNGAVELLMDGVKQHLAVEC